jgi:hypothetical protein
MTLFNVPSKLLLAENLNQLFDQQFFKKFANFE